MPVILNIGAYRFFFYSNEGNPTKAPHIHVRECPAYILLYQFSPKDTGQSKVK
ncbi:DUF4160 domain-containing protein [Desulfovibrio piger]|uniref:DUF4160 domain-containing protein n=1 Tax=Desulfovibrio piger TaxID=901 RepID=UPI002666B85B|nr:DUF4160 domain-containing protein [Desulfovibrio piger]